MKIKHIFPILAIGFLAGGCTKLNESLTSSITPEAANTSSTAAGLLTAAYYSIQPALIDQSSWQICSEHTTDEYAGPTRSANWGDGGRWRAMHQHTWTSTNDSYMNSTFENLLVMQYNATNVQNYNPSPQQKAEALFLRDFSMYITLSGWGQVPFREYNQSLSALPTVLADSAALNFIINELTTILPNLPTRSSVKSTEANQDAARALLMKCYLNRGVYQSYATRQSPTFAQSDMQMVITLASQITDLSLSQGGTEYYDNFSPTSLTASKEDIWGYQSSAAADASAGGNNVKSRWYCGLNYNQNPGGWNGFCTLSDWYYKFAEHNAADTLNDVRCTYAYPGLAATSGLVAGWMKWQQYNNAGQPITVSSSTANGPALVFLPQLDPSMFEPNPLTWDITGFRCLKYVPDYTTAGSNDPGNVDPFFRYADVVLMAAEASYRLGQTGAALTAVNTLRASRGASQLSSLALTDIYDERGFELYQENWRREDMIRFGTFLQANQLKPADPSPNTLYFPIPANDLAADANLKQNPGYN